MSIFHPDDVPDDPSEFIWMSTAPEDTEKEWAYLLKLCDLKRSIGFGALDSFLSGPDLEKRVALVETQAVKNEWLRLELADTLTLNQSNDWTPSQYHRLSRLVEPKAV